MPPENDTTLEFRDYLRVLRRRKWIVIVSVIVCTAGAFAMTFRKTPVYTASTSVILQTDQASQQFVPSQDNSVNADRQRNNEIQIMNGPEIRAEVTDKLGRAPAGVEFIPIDGTDVVVVDATSTKPKLAADTANTYANTYITERKDFAVTDLQNTADVIAKRITELDFIVGNLDSIVSNKTFLSFDQRVSDPDVISLQNYINRREAYKQQLGDISFGLSLAQAGGAKVLSPASVPQNAESNNPLSTVLAGVAIGLVLGMSLAFLREYLDDRIKSKETLEAASGETVIGLIPELPDWKNRDVTQLIAVSQPRSPAAEAYRTVRTSVEFLALDQPIGSLQVTSAAAGEGKTTTLANLAITFARVGQRVIVLCCDLRRPRVHEFFGMSNRVGFTSMLLGDAPASEAIQPVRGDLPIGLVASGPLAPNPAELLASKRAVSVIEELDSQCDLLLIDSPPVLPVTDAQVISGLVDGVLLVANAGSSNRRDVRRAVELLRQVDAPLIGSILNGIHSKHESVYTYGDNKYYTDAVPPEAKSRNGRRSKRATATTSG